MTTKICILFGGKSLEHEVSILSTKNLLPYFNRSKYDIKLVGIDRKGFWHISDEDCELKNPKPFYEVFKEIAEWGVEVFFPILHGLNGEDGTIQGLLEVANIAHVGPSVLSASIGLDKDVTKRLLREAGLPVGDFMAFTELPNYQVVKQNLSLPIYIKPANMGSTLGISVAYSESEFEKGFAQARKYDRKVICEKKVNGREFECSVMGLENPLVSLPCEIIPSTEVNTYEGKYFDQTLTKYIYPAQIEPDLIKRFQNLALEAYSVLCSEIMARVDFFYTEEDEILINEINTIPGFTKMSMFHLMWEVSNLPTDELIDRLVDYAFQRHQKTERLEHSAHAAALC